MNIFYLHEEPSEAARLQCDKHVVKMILETAQMLSTAHRVLDGFVCERINKNHLSLCEYSGELPLKFSKYYMHKTLDRVLYKATHVNHPSNVWVRENRSNYTWMLLHFYALCNEYTYRYNRKHLSGVKLSDIFWNMPRNISSGKQTPIPLAMPDDYKSTDCVQAYRNYYISKQENFKMSWTNREKPNWFK